MSKRKIFVALMLLACNPLAWAQDCQGPLRLVLGRSAGGGSDTIIRIMAQRLTAKTGRPVIVENKPGAGGNIAAALVAKAPADGCTLLATGNYHTINPLIYARAGYDLKEFVPIIRAVEGASVIVVNAAQPYKTLGTLLAYARANPARLAYGSSGTGSTNHVAMELLLKSAKVDITHVPYKGGGSSLSDTLADQVPVNVSNTITVQSHIAAGKLRALAVSSAARWPSMPDVPTVGESGFPDAVNVSWVGVLAPAATPLAVREKLNAEFAAILSEKVVNDRVRADGFEPVGGSVAEFEKFLQEDIRVSQKLMQQLQLKVE